jgi:hypothetical protein
MKTPPSASAAISKTPVVLQKEITRRKFLQKKNIPLL